MEIDGRQTIYCLGYPKSGTTWLSRLLGDALNSPVGAVYPPSSNKAIATEGRDRPGRYYIRQGHPVPLAGEFDGSVVPGVHKFAYENVTDEKVIFMYRDPRDIVVSGAHHWDRPLKEYLLHVAHGTWPMTHGGGLVPFVTTWLDSGLLHIVTTYEALNKAAGSELSRILKRLGIRPVKDIKSVVHRQSMAVRKHWTACHGDNLNYGKKFQLRFLRKGIVGDWRNHFDRELCELAEEHFGLLMRSLGYTNGPHWIDQR